MYAAHRPGLAEVLPDGAGALTERLLFEAGLLPPWMTRLYASRAWQSGVDAVERATVPGQMLAFALRKAWVDAEVRDGLACGARQVVVIGAGLDVLCARLAPERPDVLFVEIDHPATQPPKARALDAMGAALPNLRLVPADLAAEALPDVLARVEGWDPTARSVAVAEGLLMYLPEPAVRGLFARFRACSGPKSRVVFTWLARRSDGHADFGRVSGLMDRALAAVGEPVRWSIDPAALPALLDAEGFRLLGEPWRLDLRARLLAPRGLAGARLAEVERFSTAEAR